MNYKRLIVLSLLIMLLVTSCKDVATEVKDEASVNHVIDPSLTGIWYCDPELTIKHVVNNLLREKIILTPEIVKERFANVLLQINSDSTYTTRLYSDTTKLEFLRKEGRKWFYKAEAELSLEILDDGKLKRVYYDNNGYKMQVRIFSREQSPLMKTLKP